MLPEVIENQQGQPNKYNYNYWVPGQPHQYDR
jgi:hypothetical protein